MSKLERRDFIKKTVMGGIGATLLNNVYASSSEPEETALRNIGGKANPKKIIVGGAGIGGLCCAYELMKKGHDVIVLEASGRHGGHVMTGRDGLSDGLYGDYGQDHIAKPGYHHCFEYIREFNLEILPDSRRKNIMRRIDGKFYTEKMLADPQVLQGLGFNAKEISFLSKHPFWDLASLFEDKYLNKFTDEYQPFGVGYDHLDTISLSGFYKKEGASKTALNFLGGSKSSALFGLWTSAVLKLRGMPRLHTDLYRLKGGNQMLPNAFAKRLGERVWISCPISAIEHSEKGVTVTYKRYEQEQQMNVDYFVNCIPLPSFKNIKLTPALPVEKQYIINNLTYDSNQRFVFQASSKFWLDDKLSDINLHINHPDLSEIWQSADEINTHRVILLGTGPGGVSPQRALAAFREAYPGKKDSIEQAISKDWSKDSFLNACDKQPFPIGALHKFWPNIIKPHGRIHFAGAYADNLNSGIDAATRSANRVANEIDMA